MTMDSTTISTISKIAGELAQQQTVEDLKTLSEQVHEMYNYARLAAEIAVKLFLRIAGIADETRAISPIDVLVGQAEDRYHEQSDEQFKAMK